MIKHGDLLISQRTHHPVIGNCIIVKEVMKNEKEGD
tara:strand:- start:1276 stop:1383 length:108 start_codon:yes stop_codon:yes gene_type:complete